jgi:hypothetical protein
MPAGWQAKTGKKEGCKMKIDYTIFESLHNPQGTKNTASWADVCRMLQDVPAHQSKAAQPPGQSLE